MKHIVTVTFNPAIDESLIIENFKADKVNRVNNFTRFAGGKGINVATFLSSYGLELTAAGFLGESNQQIFTDHFKKFKIKDNFIRIPGDTRTGIKILDPVNSTTTDLNYPGISPSKKHIEKLFNSLSYLCSKDSLFIISGSVPAGLDSSVYKDAVKLINSKGGTVIIDTSGDAFTQVIDESPFMIKPNIDELSEYFSKSFKSESEVIESSRYFFSKGIKLLVVSMGRYGALFITENECIKAVPPQTEAISTVGAGDAMVSGTAFGIVKNLPLEETAKIATSFSLHAVTHLEMGIHDFKYLEKVREQITVFKLQ